MEYIDNIPKNKPYSHILALEARMEWTFLTHWFRLHKGTKEPGNNLSIHSTVFTGTPSERRVVSELKRSAQPTTGPRSNQVTAVGIFSGW